MKRITIVTIILTMVAIVLSACGQADTIPAEGREVKVEGGSYRDISPVQLKSMLDNKDFLFVNVHIPYEGEIPSTDLFIPYDEIEQNLSRFPEDQGAKIVVYCHSGSMSAIAAKTLVKSGFTNIWNLHGGMIEWERQGHELLRTSRPEAFPAPKIPTAGFSGGPRIYFEEESIDTGRMPAELSVGYEIVMIIH